MKEKVINWAAAAAVRAFKTACQTAVAVIGGASVLGGVDWALVGSSAALAFIVSILTSCAGIPEVDGGASLAKLVSGKEV